MKQLIIVGAGGFAREVLWLFQDCNRRRERPIELLGFVAETEKNHIKGIPVLGNDNRAFQQLDREVRFIVAIGDPRRRREIAIQYLKQGFSAHRLVHPRVQMAEDVRIGAGSIVCAGAVLTTNIELGDFVIVNLNATVGHDAVLDHFATVHPGANVSGGAQIGEGAEIGSGAVVLPGIKMGAGAVLGAGGVAVHDLEPGKIYTGVPARMQAATP
ncbi:MAG: NeuD/PglB/VioB family sugar acetyltransferase [Bacteroidota bacterium]